MVAPTPDGSASLAHGAGCGGVTSGSGSGSKSGSGSGCAAVTRIMSSRSSSWIICTLSSSALRVLVVSISRPVSESMPRTRKSVLRETDPVTRPPYWTMSACISSRSSESCVPVSTNVLPARQSLAPTGTRLLPLLGGASSFIPAYHLRGAGGAPAASGAGFMGGSAGGVSLSEVLPMLEVAGEKASCLVGGADCAGEPREARLPLSSPLKGSFRFCDEAFTSDPGTEAPAGSAGSSLAACVLARSLSFSLFGSLPAPSSPSLFLSCSLSPSFSLSLSLSRSFFFAPDEEREKKSAGEIARCRFSRAPEREEGEGEAAGPLPSLPPPPSTSLSLSFFPPPSLSTLASLS
eukprot:scaffold83181_cov25-Tisochrysis_lutea.AAC.8